LFFAETDQTSCPATSPIVANGTWAALTPSERAARRWAYAGKVAADVRVHAKGLVAAWEPAFLNTLTGAGPSNAVFKTQALALNAMSDALFYVEHEVKDVKLARPIGVSAVCVSPPCLDLLESEFGGRSKANVKANLEGFRRLFYGCGPDHAGVGFDDLLKGAGADAVLQRMTASLDKADAALAAIEEPDLRPALIADAASVRALYDAIKGATDELKTEVMTVLDLEIPMSLEGDTD
jgi:predicted lipoprotein